MTADGNAAVTDSGGQPQQPASELKMLGKYQIEKQIGAGGMGTVFLARDTQLKRLVALKVLSRDKAQNATLVKRFRAEAQAAAQLRHDNIVAIYDSGEADGYLFIAMEYVDGQDLFEMGQRRGVTPVKRSIEIIKQVAAALQHAFDQSIVHRDIKPSNLLIRRDGLVKLTDLGLARSVDDTLETNITRAGTTVGTVDYMSPEQARSSKLADIRSDIYSLGCTWYQMLTGEPPYPEGSLTNKLQAHAFKPIPDPRDKNPNVPEGLVAVLHRMMAKKPEDRYQTPAELLDDLANATLTRDAIAREIFGDLPNYDQRTARKGGARIAEVTEDGNDSHGEQFTPDEVPEASVSARRKLTKATRETGGQSEVKTRSTPSTSRDSKTNSRSDSKSVSKPADNTSSKSKSHKPLPPKRQPLENAAGAGQSGSGLNRLKYFGVVFGVIAIISGLGYLISSFGGSVAVDSNPFAGATDPKSENQRVASAAKPGAFGQKTNANTTPTNGILADQAKVGSTGTIARANSPVAEFDVEALPAWATTDANLVGLPIRSVGPGASTATHFVSLDEALKELPEAGAILQLVGSGPFPLTSFETARVKRLVVMAASAQNRPIITIQPAEAQGTAGIKLIGGALEVRGVHFTLDRSRFPAGAKFLDVIDGQLFVRQSSFTATGPDSASTVAMNIGSTHDSSTEPRLPPSILLDRVFVRGDGLKGLVIQRANADVVVSDSLLVTGSAAAIELSGYLTSGVADLTTLRPRRIVRVVRSTLSGRRCAFEVSSQSDSGGKPPRTDVVLIDSLCCAEGATANTSLLLATHWPHVRSMTESWLTRLKWISKGSLYLGFEQLVDLGPEASFKVTDASTWQRVWNAKCDTQQFHKLVFPDSTPNTLSEALPQEYDIESLSYREIKSTSGGLPGCAIKGLSAPDVVSQQRGSMMALRPRLPSWIGKPGEPVAIRKVDLKKQDLGTILNKDDWPSGTLIEASGNGLCLMSPAKIDGKAVRIVFQQVDGVPLKLQSKTSDGRDSGASAVFSVSHGSLELTNASIEGRPDAKPGSPPWLIEASDSSLILNGCRLQGSDADGPHQQGLVRWTAKSPVSPNPSPPLLVCLDSCLASFGCGIRVEAGQGHVIVKNCIIAIRGAGNDEGNGLDLRPVRAEGLIRPVLVAEQVTFSCTGAAIRVQAAVGSDDVVTSPMRLFVERCAVVPPLVFKAGEAANATFLKTAGPVIEQKQIEWCGTSNGVAIQVVHFLHRDGDPLAASDTTGVAAWRRVWNAANDERLLVGDKGVYLAGNLQGKWKELRPVSFELHRVSQAATWAEGGKPIGADVRVVEGACVAKKAGTQTTIGTKKAPATKTPPARKEVGF